MANAHLKWSIFYAGLSGSEVQIKHPANRRGEGLMMPEAIERRILPYLGEWGIQLPIAIKTYYSARLSGVNITTYGEKSIFAPTSPREDPAEFTYYVSEDGVVFEIDRNMKIQIPA